MSLSTQPYKGARDFYPEDKRLQKYMYDVMRTAVEKFGYALVQVAHHCSQSLSNTLSTPCFQSGV